MTVPASPAIEIAATIAWARGDCDVCVEGVMVDQIDEVVFAVLCPRCIVPKLATLRRLESRVALGGDGT